MYSVSRALRILARKMGVANVSSRDDLEAKLAPLLCLVLRTGMGYPSLLQWVQLTLPVVAPEVRLGSEVDPKWAARKLARLLCSQFLQDVLAQRDTTLNRKTIPALAAP